jgi:hypothetical protein
MFGPRGNSTVAGIVYSAAGGIIAARRPSNPIGWLCLAVGLVTAFLGMSEAYAFWGLLEHGGSPPLAVWAGWVVEWAFIVQLVGMGLIAAVFPDGRWRSRRWKVAILVGCAGAAVGLLANALEPTFTIFAGVDNPIGIRGDLGRAVVQVGSGVTWIFGLVVLLGGAASAVARFRDSTGEERQQLKWLALASSVLVLACTAFGVVTLASGALGTNPGGFEWLEDLAIAGVIALPIGIAIAVLRYRLYDIDRIISRTVTYFLLTALLIGVYALIVVGIGTVTGGSDNPVLIAGATLVVAAVFGPARRRLQGGIDRRLYRRRYDAERVLGAFSALLRDQLDLGALSSELQATVTQAVQPSRVSVWIRGPGEPK